MRSVLLLLAIGLGSASALAQDDELEIVNLAVGQGDATLIMGPADASGDRVTVLFDSGNIRGLDGGSVIREYLASRGIRELDFLIISHDDADHLGGVAFGDNHGRSFILGFDDSPGGVGDDDGDGQGDWLGSRPFFTPDPEELGTGDDVIVRHFVDYGDALMRAEESDAIVKYQAIANAMGERIVLNAQDDVDSFEIDLGGGARLICFAANGFVRGRSTRVPRVNTPNERSLSFLLTYRDFGFLISGDLIGRASGAENARVERAVGEAIRAAEFEVDILRVNHHGADNASDESFLELIEPRIAIISAGNRNTHEHPRNEALQRLADAGVELIAQTAWGSTPEEIPPDVRDRQAIYQGHIIVRTDGASFVIETRRGFDAQ